MRLKLHELQQRPSLETYINNLDTLARNLELPEQQKIYYFIFGLKFKFKHALLIQQPRHTTTLLPLQSRSTTSQIPILILS